MIYMTPFDPATKQCTAKSAPAGVATLDDVPLVFGTGWLTKSKRTLIYTGLAFTNYVLRVEE